MILNNTTKIGFLLLVLFPIIYGLYYMVNPRSIELIYTPAEQGCMPTDGTFDQKTYDNCLKVYPGIVDSIKYAFVFGMTTSIVVILMGLIMGKPKQ